jgi:hypothetical protein
LKKEFLAAEKAQRNLRGFAYYGQVSGAGSGGMTRFLFMALVILGLIGFATMLAFVLR